MSRKFRSPYVEACSTKAKRAALAKSLKTIVEKHGAACVITPEDDAKDSYRYREVRCMVTRGPFRLAIDFSGRLALDGFLGAWHMDLDSDETYPRDFRGGDLNTSHFCKATAYSTSWVGFVGKIEAGLAQLAKVPA